MAQLQAPAVGTPEWWLLRLLRGLEWRAPELRLWESYFEGDQPLRFASQKFRESFGDRFPAFTSNFCQLVVEGVAERLQVQAFRFTDPNGDDDVWRLWQENELDAGSQLAHLEALVKGVAYALVEPAGSPDAFPTITVEDPLDAIVECDPRSRRTRRAGLKRWVDDEQRLVAMVYLPEGAYRYRTTAKWQPEHERWWMQPGNAEVWGSPDVDARLWAAVGFQPYQLPEDPDWPLPNPMGVVQLVELPNRPRLRTGMGQSEIAPIRSNQDAVNKYRCDALIASEFVAFPQRYLLNYEPPDDEETGRPKEPFRAGIDRLWTVPPPDPEIEGAPSPQAGQFPAADLTPYERMISLEVGHISAISRLPYHYLLGTPQTVPPSGESLKASEAGLEHKVARAEVFLGAGWEETMRVALLAMSDEKGRVRTAETLWHDTETRNEAVRTDAIVKLHAEGIIDDQLAWELAGLSPQQISDLRARREAEAEQAPAGPPAGPGTVMVGDQGPEVVVPAPTGPRMG